MHHPHLVTRAAGRNVKALLEEFLVAHGKWAALCSIHERDENNVALVALELRGVAAEQAVKLVAIGRDARAQEIVDFERLLIADQRKDYEAKRLARAVVLIFGLLIGRRDARGGGRGFLALDVRVVAG